MRRVRVVTSSVVILAVLAFGTAAAAAVTFAPGVDYPLPDPSAPTPAYGGLAVGDLNGDGRPELMVPRANADKLWVFAGNGDGTFAAATSTPSCAAGYNVFGRAASPFLVLQCSAGQFELLPGDGHGGFGAASDTGAISSRGGLAIGSLDGQQDLVFDTGNSVSQNICLIDIGAFTDAPKCDSSGDFKERTNQFALANIFPASAGQTTRVVNLADANDFGFVGYATDWTGYSTRPSSSDNGWAVAAGDLNGDGVDDVVAVNIGASTTAGTVYSMLADAGTGGFALSDHGTFAGTAIPDPSWVQLADFDGDGKLDLIVAGTDNNGLLGNPEFAVMPGHGDGTFGPAQPFSTGFSPDSTAWWLGVADLNGDGKADVVIANGDEQKVRVFLNATAAQPTGGGGGPGGGGPGGGGGSGGGGGGLSPVTVTNVHVTSKTFRVGRLLPRLSRLVPIGTTISFSVDQPARVTFAFTSLRPGKRAGARCVAPTPKLRHAKSCTRRLAAGTLSYNASAGSHKLLFDGQLSRHKALRPGKYELAITATAGGTTSKPTKLGLTLLPAAKR